MEQNGHAVAIRAQSAPVDFTNPEVVKALMATVAVGLTKEEFFIFAEHCKGTGLSPVKKEVWAIKAGGRLQVMTGINGYWQIANSHPQFDGAETGMIDKSGAWVKSVTGNDFIGAWCKIYRKDRRMPMEGEALLSDYRKSGPLWEKTPRIMIKKVAQSIALRTAFSQELNGLYTAEEMPPEYNVTPEPQALPAGIKTAEQLQAEQCTATAAALGDDHPPSASEILAEQNLGPFIYNLVGYPFKGDKHKTELIKKLKTKGAEEIAPYTYLCPEYLEGLKDYIRAEG